MELTLTEATKIKTFKKCISVISNVSDELIFDATIDSVSISCIDSCTSILLILEFKNSFFDNFSFSLSERVLRSLPSKHVSNILKSTKCTECLIRVISSEKVIIILTDIYGITHKFTVFASETESSSVSPINGCFSTIECPSDIFQSTKKWFESRTDLSTLTLGKTGFRIETNADDIDKGSVILTVLKSDECKINARFKTKLRLMFSDVITSAKLASTLSKRMVIFIEEKGPVTVKAESGGFLQMKATIAAQTTEEDERYSEDDEENIDEMFENRTSNETIIFTKKSKTAGALTSPHMEQSMFTSRRRSEAPFISSDKPQRRDRHKIIEI